MSSTSHKNSTGNYQQEQATFQKKREYDFYPGAKVNTLICLPGDGLLCSRMHPTMLSNNSVDIESDLFGIGSSNLVKKKPIVLPEIKNLKSLAIFEKRKVQLPALLEILPNQRPFNI